MGSVVDVVDGTAQKGLKRLASSNDTIYDDAEAGAGFLLVRGDGAGGSVLNRDSGEYEGIHYIATPPPPFLHAVGMENSWRGTGPFPLAKNMASGCFLSKHPQKKRRSMLPPSLVFAETGRGAWSGVKNGECGEWRTKSEEDGMKLYPKSTFTALGHWYRTGRAAGNDVLNQESTCTHSRAIGGAKSGITEVIWSGPVIHGRK
ncbi:hypothetical protein BD779DRAFT_1471636 [Infundibulicybe gibba]|nr:hypothetical protein BD779DRAFT_1471636 [Infundibulicybe gibba]